MLFGRIYGYCKREYRLLTEKKYTTVAGTLVFFLLMSLMPFAVWLTLIFGRLDEPFSKILSMPVFASVKNILLYVQKEAHSASSGASVFFIVTALYSATGLFYHMRRSGELIYNDVRHKSGFRVRFGALFFMFAVMLLLVVLAFVYAMGAMCFAKIPSVRVERLLDYFLLLLLSFLLVWALNGYVCPYKVRPKELLIGALATVIAWAPTLIGFAIYLKLGSKKELYGALGTLFVFLLWLYVLTVCFVGGVIINSRRIEKKEEKRF